MQGNTKPDNKIYQVLYFKGTVKDFRNLILCLIGTMVYFVSTLALLPYVFLTLESIYIPWVGVAYGCIPVFRGIRNYTPFTITTASSKKVTVTLTTDQLRKLRELENAEYDANVINFERAAKIKKERSVNSESNGTTNN